MEPARFRDTALPWKGIAFVSFIAGVAFWAYNKERASRKQASIHISQVRTGDLVFFERAYPSLDGLITHFSHVGVALVLKGEPHIIEIHAADEAKGLHMAGIGVYPLHWRAKRSQTNIYITQTPYVITPKQILDALPAFEHVAYPEDYRIHYLASCLTSSVSTTSMICSEFSAKLLSDVGIPNIPRRHCLSPDSLLHIYNVEPRKLLWD